MKNSKVTWPNTQITELLKISLPLIQAPMAGGATTPELVAAVSNAGGLGSLGAGYMQADEIQKEIKKIRELTDKPFAVNLFIPEAHHATDEQLELARQIVQTACGELKFRLNAITPPYAPLFDEQMDVILTENVPVFSFTFGVPDSKWIKKCKQNQIRLIGTATTLEEAKLLEKYEIDAIVAQGSEAGGHRGTFIDKSQDELIHMSSLVAMLSEQINIPIIAAGGIMNGNGILSALESGASAVQMGTVFLCCTESGIHPLYRKTLLNTKHDDTILTRAFSGKFARGIKNKFILRMLSHGNEILDYPIQNSLTSAMRKESAKHNCADFMSMWAGQSVSLCKELPASQLIHELNNQVLALLNEHQ